MGKRVNLDKRIIYVAHSGKVMASRLEKTCLACGKKFFPTCSTQKYCGSKTKKTGCSWLMVKERDKVRSHIPARIKKNLEAQKEWNKKQRRLHTDYAKRQACLKSRYRTRKRNVVGSHSYKQWKSLKEEHGGRCSLCGKETILTKDHIIPISKGGTDDIWNIQPLCRSCNSSKKDKFIGSKVVCISGGMDCLHVGHLDYLKGAAKYGKVIVILNSDEWLMKKKGYIFMPWAERAEIISNLVGVYGVASVKDDDGTVCEALKRIKPHYFGNGGDRNESNTPELDLCNKLGIVPLFNLGGEKRQSSSRLMEMAMKHYPNGFSKNVKARC